MAVKTGQSNTPATDPSARATVIGNRDLLLRFERDLRDSRLSHAYILDGKPGSGRHTIALWLSAAIACRNRPGQALAIPEDTDQMGFFDLDEPLPPPEIPPDAPLPCLDCPACRKVLEDKCPDITVIGRDGKASIGVEAVRPIRRDVLIPPNDLDTKIYIIEDADCMTPQAQNALLLTLEEPPPYVLFLLLCNGAENLLETIRSRAPTLRTTPVPDADIRAYLRARKCTLSEPDLEAVLLRADGCIGQALTLSDAKAVKPILKLRETCDAFLDAYVTRKTDAIPTLLGRFGQKRDAVRETVDLLTLAVRDLTLLRYSESVGLKYYTDRAAAEELAGRFTARSLLRLKSALDHAAAALEANGGVRLVLMQMAVELGF